MKTFPEGPDWRPGTVTPTTRHARLIGAALALFFTLAFVLASHAVDPPPSGRTFDSLTVRGTTYTRVNIVDVSKRHVSFRSAQGFATVLLEDLEPGALAQLGRGPLNAGAIERSDNAAKTETKSSKIVPVHAREKPDGAADAAADSDDDAVPITPFHWTIRSIAGMGLLGLGILVVSAGHLWLVGAAFRTSAGWGIAVLIGTFVAGIITVMFCRRHWDVARRPVFLKLAGLVLLVGGFLLFHS